MGSNFNHHGAVKMTAAERLLIAIALYESYIRTVGSGSSWHNLDQHMKDQWLIVAGSEYLKAVG